MTMSFANRFPARAGRCRTPSAADRALGGAGVDGRGLRFAIEGVTFCTPDNRAIAIGEVPPRIFSEVMRALDLVVSTAHTIGVDPEASASTTAMRAALVTETCRLVGLDNVAVHGPRAVIAGDLGEWSVHLGSGVVHRRPGGAVCIIPVHGEHAGRVFLPFADDDPRTAEVLAKVLLLARDREIRDPSILDQLRGGPGLLS